MSLIYPYTYAVSVFSFHLADEARRQQKDACCSENRNRPPQLTCLWKSSCTQNSRKLAELSYCTENIRKLCSAAVSVAAIILFMVWTKFSASTYENFCDILIVPTYLFISMMAIQSFMKCRQRRFIICISSCAFAMKTPNLIIASVSAWIGEVPSALKNTNSKRQTTWKASTFLALSFVCNGPFLRSCSPSPLITLNKSFDFSELPSPQRLHGEPSPSQRRRLAKSMTSLRQLVKFKGAVQSVPKFASDNPLKWFSQSPGPPPTPPRGREAIRMVVKYILYSTLASPS